MTLEKNLVLMVYVAAQLARKQYKYINLTTDPNWITSLIETREWLAINGIRL